MFEAAWPDFDRAAYLRYALDGFEKLELTPRARRISDALARVLPVDATEAVECVIRAMRYDFGDDKPSGLGSLLYMPFGFFIADHGLECFEASMRAQYELTQRFTAEFSIRAFLERYPDATLGLLEAWAADPNVHVRRLVSEGTRPRLPWASRLRGFQEDPTPVLRLLELLKDDPEEYVRRSVANNLNDITKDNPDAVIAVARRWWSVASRRRLIRHALRSLVKAGDPQALEVLGYGSGSEVQVRSVRCEPRAVDIGGKVRIGVELLNPTSQQAGVLVDLRVHFMKSSGSTSPKVFKGSELVLDAGEAGSVRKTISLAQHTTRRHYPGEHSVEVLLNGVAHPGMTFQVR